jgi:rare lipoprotein A
MRIGVGPWYGRRDGHSGGHTLLPLIGAAVLGACASARPPTRPPTAQAPPVRGEPSGRDAIRPAVRRLPLGRPVIEVSDSAIAEIAASLRPALSTASGEATYYANKFDGRRTASGIVFRNSKPYAAHRKYPFGTVLRVTNQANQRSIVVTVVDRGPHGTSARARRTIIDLSRSAAEQLGFVSAGRTPVRVEVLEWGDGRTLW